MTQRGAVTVLGCVIVAATAVAITELARGATNNGVTIANPCKERAPFPGHGIDATIQRVVLDGFDGAACRLRTSREQLVLSLRGGSHRWNRRTIETALRAGLLRAVDDAERRGDIPGYLVPLVRRVVERAPLDKLIQGGISLSDVLG